MRRTLLLLSLCLFSTPSFAASIVIHGGSGRDCYLETLQENATGDRNLQSLAICNQAVADASADFSDTYNYAAALVNRADVKLRVADYAGVVADAQRAVVMNSGLGPAQLNLGAGLVGQQRYREALPYLDKAIALNANRVEMAYFDRGIAKESMGDILGAYHDYLKATEIDPNFERAKKELARFKVTNTDS